jgi:hypothetical protein
VKSQRRCSIVPCRRAASSNAIALGSRTLGAPYLIEAPKIQPEWSRAVDHCRASTPDVVQGCVSACARSANIVSKSSPRRRVFPPSAAAGRAQ